MKLTEDQLNDEKISRAYDACIDLQQEYKRNKKKLEDLDKEIKKTHDRQNKLLMHSFGYGKRGLIVEAELELRHELTIFENKNRRKVVFKKEEKTKSFYLGRARDYIVEKVTPKRIYIRPVTSSAKGDFYDHDGCRDAYQSTPDIDVEKTFPEGVKEFMKNQKSK